MKTKTMIRAAAFVAFAASAAALIAHTPAPFPVERLLLDAIASAAGSPATEKSALEALESIAEGRPVDIEKWESRVAASTLPDKSALTNPTVRAYALTRIGRLSSQDALRYLENLTPAALGPDTTGELIPAAGIAHQNAIVDRIQGHTAQIEYLEGVAQEKDKAPWFGTRSWAIDELCDRGSLSSLPAIEKALEDIWGDQSEEQREFCEARIRIVAANENRAQALGAALQIRQNPDLRLMMWAATQLGAMKTEDAERELNRFWLASGGDLKVDDQSSQTILSVRETVRWHRAERANNPTR